MGNISVIKMWPYEIVALRSCSMVKKMKTWSLRRFNGHAFGKNDDKILWKNSLMPHYKFESIFYFFVISQTNDK